MVGELIAAGVGGLVLGWLFRVPMLLVISIGLAALKIAFLSEPEFQDRLLEALKIVAVLQFGYVGGALLRGGLQR